MGFVLTHTDIASALDGLPGTYYVKGHASAQGLPNARLTIGAARVHFATVYNFHADRRPLPDVMPAPPSWLGPEPPYAVFRFFTPEKEAKFRRALHPLSEFLFWTLDGRVYRERR